MARGLWRVGCGSGAGAAGAGGADGLVHQVGGDVGEFEVLVLAECAQRVERLLGGVAGAAAQDADGLVDDRAGQHCLLQLGAQPAGLRMEPLASVLMRSAMIAGIAAAAVGLCFLQRDRVRDITGLLQDRTALLRDRTGLLTELAGVEQRERAELAEHLHDGALQYLLAAAQDLQEVEQDGDQQALARVRTALTESTGLLRSTVSDLHPAVLEQAGLAAAVQALLASVARGRLRAEVSAQNWPTRLRTAVDGLLYSSVREFVGNVVKHAQASLVVVTLRREQGNAVVTVVDDGVGLDPQVLTSRLAQGHIGLQARRVRLEAAGGSLQFTTGPGGGTTVTMTVPLTGHA